MADPGGCSSPILRLGLTGLVLGTLMPRRVSAEETWTLPDGKPQFQPKAKRVIWLFMLGGVSHVESFDPKPVLNQVRGQAACGDALSGRPGKSIR